MPIFFHILDLCFVLSFQAIFYSGSQSDFSLDINSLLVQFEQHMLSAPLSASNGSNLNSLSAQFEHALYTLLKPLSLKGIRANKVAALSTYSCIVLQ